MLCCSCSGQSEPHLLYLCRLVLCAVAGLGASIQQRSQVVSRFRDLGREEKIPNIKQRFGCSQLSEKPERSWPITGERFTLSLVSVGQVLERARPPPGEKNSAEGPWIFSSCSFLFRSPFPFFHLGVIGQTKTARSVRLFFLPEWKLK